MPTPDKSIEHHQGFRDKCYNVKKHITPTKRFYWIDGKMVEERPQEKEVDFPKIANWNPEWSYFSVGKRLSKKELKEYCKRNNKIWENE